MPTAVIPLGIIPTPWGLVAAGLAVLAMMLVWPAAAQGRALTTRRRRLPRWVRGRADAAPYGRRLLGGGMLGLAVTAMLLRAGPLPALAGGAMVAATGAIVLGWLEPGATRAARRRRIADTPQALDLLASCLAAGLPVRSALRAVVDVMDGPLAADLGQVVRLTELGHDDVSAWRTLARHEQLGPAALDLARSVETGALLVESLLVHAELAREERHGQVEEAARRVGVRSVLPLMVCFIPAFLLLGIVPTVASAVLNALHF
ncbi:MAG TPA: type II secretion system F family protein [Microlunatus sp.]